MAKWMVYHKKEDFMGIARACGISPVLARVIRNRDVIGMEATRRYLDGTMDMLHDPYLLPDMDRAVSLLEEKIRQGRDLCLLYIGHGIAGLRGRSGCQASRPDQ